MDPWKLQLGSTSLLHTLASRRTASPRLSCLRAVVTYEMDADTESPTKVTGIGVRLADVEAAAVETATRMARTTAVSAARTG